MAYGLTTHSSHLMPNQRLDSNHQLNRPNSEELSNTFDPHCLTTDERQLSLPNLDQLTDDDINNQFESMLVSDYSTCLLSFEIIVYNT